MKTLASVSYRILVVGVASMGTQNSGEGKLIQRVCVCVSMILEGGNLGWGWEIPGPPHPLYETLLTNNYNHSSPPYLGDLKYLVHYV